MVREKKFRYSDEAFVNRLKIDKFATALFIKDRRLKFKKKN